MPIPLRCAADGCTFSEELPDGATVKGKPAVQWWREDCNYRCREHRDGNTEHDLAVQRVQQALGATIVMDGKEAHARQEAYRRQALPPLASPSDPENAQVAADLFEPRRGTAKANVLDYLQARVGVWVKGHELCEPAVGGEEGKRRARELRQAGHPIEIRPTSKGAWEYRYANAVSEQAAKDEIVRQAAIQKIVDLDGVLPSAAAWAVEQKVVNADGRSLIYHEPGRKIV